jgi:hypothetical protein
VGADKVVLALDEPEELLGEIGLGRAPEGGKGEADTFAAIAGASLVGTDGQCSIPDVVSG